MQKIMQADCAVFRTGDVLKQGVSKLKQVWDAKQDIKVTDRSLIWNSDLAETLEFDNLMYQAMVTIVSAENRQESRGAHSRLDHPNLNDFWGRHNNLIARDGETMLLAQAPLPEMPDELKKILAEE